MGWMFITLLYPMCYLPKWPEAPVQTSAMYVIALHCVCTYIALDIIALMFDKCCKSECLIVSQIMVVWINRLWWNADGFKLAFSHTTSNRDPWGSSLGSRKGRKVLLPWCKFALLLALLVLFGAVSKRPPMGVFWIRLMYWVQKYPGCYLDERDNAWFFSIQAPRSKQILIKTCANQNRCLLPHIPIRLLLIRV